MRIQYNPHRTCVSRISFPLVKSKTSRKVKSEKSSRKPVTTFDVRSREWRRGTHALFLTSCVERVLLYPPCARAHHARRALRTLRPHAPPTPRHVPTARRAHRDHSTRSHRDHSTAHALSCSNRTRCHSVTRGGSQRQSETRRIRDARRHTRPWPRCRPHMHTTHAHHTCTPNRLSSLRGERHDVS
jgi:hypothetical protein